MSLNYLADKFVIWNLKKISYGYLELIDSVGNHHSFGNTKSSLKAKAKINDPNFYFKLLRKGSIGLAESYINNEFQTEDLSSLIELSARNIQITYKFFSISIHHFFSSTSNFNVIIKRIF